MTYQGLFSSYDLSGKGREWIKSIDPEDRAVFVQIGLEENGHGQMGGRAIYMQKGREYMSKIGRIGAIKTNSIKAWKCALQEELNRELGVTFDY
jgi:hypothetical protein